MPLTDTLSLDAATLAFLLAMSGKTATADRPGAPPGTRLYAVGDIHGRADLLRDMHRRIHEDASRARASRTVVVYLGDYIDRGSASREVVELLLDTPLQGFERFHLRGNHDHCFTRFLSDIGIAELWLSHGGDDTLRSYGVVPPRSLSDARETRRAQSELRQRLPERHAAFFLGLSQTHCEGNYFFVHAGIRPGIPLEQQATTDMLWIEDDFLNSDLDHGKIIVHGHSVTERPQVRRNRIGIDTGAFATGTLTCLVLQGTRRLFLQT